MPYNIIEIIYTRLEVCVCIFRFKESSRQRTTYITLLEKLADLNLSPHFYQWIANYLCQRTHAVVVGGEIIYIIDNASSRLRCTPGLCARATPFSSLYQRSFYRIQLSDGTLILFADDIVV